MVQHGEFSDYDFYAEGKPNVILETDPANYYEVEQYGLAYGPDGSHVLLFYQRLISTYIQSFCISMEEMHTLEFVGRAL